MTGSTALKIGGVTLAVGAILIFIVFGFLQEESSRRTPSSATPGPDPKTALPPIVATATSPSVPVSPAPLPKEVDTPPEKKEEPTKPTQLPVCEPREFIVRIFDFDKAEPPSLAVHTGDTVTFINEDNDLRWPGADPHPTHSSLPLFDALGGISQDQSYSHTFKKEGIYGWHDHLPDDPPTVGFITVLPCLRGN